MTTTPAEPPALLLRAASVAVNGQPLLRGIDLAIARGEHVAVIGPSGAGKTTLLRLCAGLIAPTSGSVLLHGEPLSTGASRSARRQRCRLGMLPQQHALIPGLRVAHNVLMGHLGRWSTLRSLWSLLFPQQIASAQLALQQVELGDRLWALPDELSGGEQQRVALARLLVQAPEVLLADEPATGLDPRLAPAMFALLHRVAEERRATLVVVLHSLALLDAAFARVIALHRGGIAWVGTPAELTPTLLQRIYANEPQVLHELGADDDR